MRMRSRLREAMLLDHLESKMEVKICKKHTSFGHKLTSMKKFA